MSKEDILKIQTCVLKVNIHCDGCRDKVRKILHKIDGVYKTSIDSEQGKVTVSGNVNPDTLIRKLGKNGKHAELWGGSKCNYQNQLNNQFQNFQIDHSGKNGNNKNNKGGNYQQMGGGGGGGGGLGQMKGFQDLKLPQFKGLKLPFGGGKHQNQKAVKFKLAEEDGMSVDYDDEFDEFDDEMDDSHHNANKMKAFMGNGGGKQMPNMMMNDMNSQANGGGGNGGNNEGNGKKGGGRGENIPVLVNESGGKKVGSGGGGGNVNNQNQGGSGKNGGKNGGGQQSGGKCNNNGGGAQSKHSNNSHGGGGAHGVANGNGVKKGSGFNDGIPGMPNMMNGYPGIGGTNIGQMGNNLSMGQIGNYPIGHMGQMPAVQGQPTAGMNGGGGGGGGGGYFTGGLENLAGNSYQHQEHQQQLAAMMMNQQRANGNERFQPMMYARPPPAVNYIPPYPYQYQHPHQADPYTHVFSDENTSSCNVM